MAEQPITAPAVGSGCAHSEFAAQSSRASSGATSPCASAGTTSEPTAAALPQGALPASVLMLGVGGMGMAPLAIYLAQAGVSVYGCDDHLQPRVRTLLEAAGVRLFTAAEVREGFAAGAFEGVRLCAVSSAIGAGHALLALARCNGMHVVRRGELLAHVSRTRRLLAIVGSHGKTTTTGLIIEALGQAGLTFDYVLGGLFQDAARPPARHHSDAQWLVAEVDESDGTISHFAPELTVAVNFDWDHADRYSSAAALRDTFAALFERTRGPVIFPADDAVLASLVSAAQQRPCTVSSAAKVKGFNGYNQSLACAALAELAQCGALDAVQLQSQAEGICFDNFCGIFRRQEWLYRSDRLQIMTDYAHHPREVAALLAYLRAQNPQGRLVAVFQPHRYTRTRQFAGEFARVLENGADTFFLMPVYAASETACADGQTEAIARACHGAGSGRSEQTPVTASAQEQSEDAACSVPADGSSGCSSSAVRVYRDWEIATACREYLNDLSAAVGAAAAAESVAVSDRVAAGSAPARSVSAAASVAELSTVTTLVFVGAGDIDELARRVAADCALRDVWATQLDPRSELRLAEPLARRTTMRLGGSARFYAEPATREDVGLLVRLAAEAGLRVWLLGRGSNLIVPDEGFDGLIIAFNAEIFRLIEPQPDGNWYVGSGVALKRLCSQAARAGLDGWEFLDGIPGTVGGALRMNAGAMGRSTFDVVVAVDVLEPSGAIVRRAAESFDVGYRRCGELASGGCVALGAVLRPGGQATVDAVRERLDNYASRRRETQPREPSAGCIFKNPQGHHAGALIDELGLKGLRVGGAEVSGVHGNFIINRGDATAADVMELVRQIRARVLQERGIVLEPEALLLGLRWEDVL